MTPTEGTRSLGCPFAPDFRPQGPDFSAADIDADDRGQTREDGSGAWRVRSPSLRVLMVRAENRPSQRPRPRPARMLRGAPGVEDASVLLHPGNLRGGAVSIP